MPNVHSNSSSWGGLSSPCPGPPSSPPSTGWSGSRCQSPSVWCPYYSTSSTSPQRKKLKRNWRAVSKLDYISSKLFGHWGVLSMMFIDFPIGAWAFGVMAQISNKNIFCDIIYWNWRDSNWFGNRKNTKQNYILKVVSCTFPWNPLWIERLQKQNCGFIIYGKY